MPIINVPRSEVLTRLALPLDTSDDAFGQMCFDYGLELDEVTSEREKALRETGKVDESLSEEPLYKIDIPANRYDLLSLEGFVMALRVFLGRDSAYPTFQVTQAQHELHVDPSVNGVRPFVVAAVLRGINFTQSSLDSFIAVQDKLHETLCRRRTLASVGTHDLDTIKGPFKYAALAPEDIHFVPLKRTASVNGHELMEILEADMFLGKYLHIIRDSPVYPVILDADGVVCSLPPIINGEHSKMTLSTRNVLLEVTGTDLTKASLVLNTLVTMFSQYSETPFSIERVKVTNGDETTLYPDLSSRTMTTKVDYVRTAIGVDDLDGAQMVNHLRKMGLGAELQSDGETLSVVVGPTRSDIMHPCDLVEDVAIGYGYTNMKPRVPKTLSDGRQQPLEAYAEALRFEVAEAGWTELLTFVLVSQEENYDHLLLPNDGQAVVLANPATFKFQQCRTTLLPGLLKKLAASKGEELPLRYFEVGDTVHLDSVSDVGARNNRWFGAVYASHTAGFEHVHGLLDRVMRMLAIDWTWETPVELTPEELERVAYVKKPSAFTYHMDACEEPFMFPKAQFAVSVQPRDQPDRARVVGHVGVVHPAVLANYRIRVPASVLLLDLQYLVHVCRVMEAGGSV